MAAIEIQESMLPAFDGTRLFTICANLPNPRANVILTHGLGEHSGRYLHVAEFFAARGLRLCAYDLRGHGRSEGIRGRLNKYSDFLADLASVLGHFSMPDVPSFLYGHSLGGQITLNFLADRQPEIAGAIIASPWLRLAFTPNRLKLFLAKTALRFWPEFTQNKPSNVHLLSRDQAFLKTLSNPVLVHHRVSARMYAEISRGAQAATETPSQFRWPLLILHGASDSITSHRATREFFEKVGLSNKTLLSLPEHLHELHNDIGRDAVLAHIADWIAARAAQPPVAGNYAMSSQSP